MKDNFEKQYIILSVIFLLAILTPTILGFICCIDDFSYSWLTNSPIDSISYMGKINNGKYFDSIEYVVRSNHQTDDMRGGYLFTLYSIFGLIFGNLGLSSGLIFTMMKVFFAVMFLISGYFFIKEFINKKNRYFTALLLLFTSSATNLVVYFKIALGINQTATQYLPADIYPIESVFAAPHFTYAIALILLSCICINRFHKNKWKYSIINGILLFLISTIHPQVAVFVGAVEGIFVLSEIKSKSYKLKDLLPVSLWGIIPLPYLIYNVYILKNYYSLQVWMTKNIHPYDMGTIIFFFLPSIVLLIYLLCKKRKIIKENKLFFIWGVMVISTIFLPGNFQVKMTEGSSIPMIILLAQLLLDFNFKKIVKVSQIGIAIILIPITCTTIIPKYSDTLIYHPDYYYELYADVDELEYPSVILSNAFTSALVYANTKQVFPVAAHQDESLKYEEYSALYSKNAEKKDFSFLEKLTDIDYYIYDKHIAKNYNTVEIETNLPYEKIKETENYIIYNLRNPVKGEN